MEGPSDPRPTKVIDHYSVTSLRIEMFFNETHLSTGTGFVWEHNSSLYLITNWHNVSGKNPFTGKHLSPHASEPNALCIWFNIAGQLGMKGGITGKILDQDDQPCWFIHPKHGSKVDIAAIPLGSITGIDPYPINRMPTEPLSYRVGHDVFVLGYPNAIHAHGFPIWKRASIASEPEFTTDEVPYFLLDTATRPGMSGSPVIRRASGAREHDNGSVIMGPGDGTRFVGIYSGRLAAGDQLEAQLGMVWPTHLIEEIVSAQVLDRS